MLTRPEEPIGKSDDNKVVWSGQPEMSLPMENPLFVEPSPTTPPAESGRPFDPLRKLPGADTPLTLEISHTTDPLIIMNFETQLPAPSTARERLGLVRAGRNTTDLDEEAWHAISRSFTDLGTATALVRGGLFLQEVAESATLLSVPGHIYLNEVFPIIQPRTAASAGVIAPPEVSGLLDDAGQPMAALALKFRDRAHFAAYMRQTIIETRVEGRAYDESILSRRVSRPVLVHAARIDFATGEESIWVLVVRDGITRTVSSWAARLGGSPTPEAVADYAVEQLLATRPARAGKASTATQDHARGREQAALGARAAFMAGTTDASPNEQAIRVGQTFTLPAHVCVGLVPGSSTPLPPSEIFDDAQRSVVSSIHIDFKGWDEAAGQAEVIDRALRRVVHRGALTPEVVALATGALGVEETPVVFGDPDIPAEPLWRSTYLIAALTAPGAMGAIKAEMRSLLGLRRIANRRYVGHLAPVVDRIWRLEKAKTLPMARRAWSQNGPVPSQVLGAAWHPVPTDDFTKLVPMALAGDSDAKFTLMVAGGTALVTDKLISSNVGSALTSGRVPFRADPAEIVAGLGNSEAGLWLLARAANAFDASRAAVNSFTENELAQGDGKGSYVVPRLDPEDPSRIKTDNAGAPEPITDGEIVRLSDPDRAAGADVGREKRRPKAEPTPTPSEQAATLRQRVVSRLSEADYALKALLNLRSQIVGHPFGSHDVWENLNRIVSGLQAAVYVNEPRVETHRPYAADVDADDAGATYGDDLSEDGAEGE